MNKKYTSFLKYICMFLFLTGLYIIIIYLEKAYPFGTHSFLYCDANDQYYSMFQEMLRWIHGGNSGSILWDRGLGVDFYTNMLYYGMSPYNIIILIMGSGRLELSMIIVTVVKIASIGTAALYYFEHTNLIDRTKHERSLGLTCLSFVCACSYALCGYVMAYNHNMIWLDGLIILPLLALAIEKMNCENKIAGYFVLLVLTFITNFYFSFYICIFAVIYFLLLDRENFQQFIHKGLIFAGVSILAALTSAVVLVPALVGITAISSNADEKNIGMLSVGNLCDFWESFYPARQLDGMGGSSVFTHNNFCGTIIFIMMVMFFLNKNTLKKRKIKYGIAMLFLILGLNWSGLNYVMHGFTFTHGIGNRFAFILLFIIIMAVFQTVADRELVLDYRIGIGLICIIIVSAISLFINDDKGNPYSYIGFLFLMTVYIALLIFRWRKSIKVKTFYIWILGLWMLELIANAIYVAPEKYDDYRFVNLINLNEWETVYNELECAPGERKTSFVSDIYMETSNVNWYSSLANGSAIDSFKSLGLSRYQNIEYMYRATTRLSALMYNVRYILTNETSAPGGYHCIQESDAYSIYEADTLAGMGFVLNEEILNWEGLGTPADNQNAFVDLGFDGSQLFDEVDISNAAVSCMNMELLAQDGMTFEYETNSYFTPCVIIEFTASKDMDLYIESSDIRGQGITVFVDGEMRVDTAYAESESLMHVGNVKKDAVITIAHYSTFSLKTVRGTKNIKVYSFDNEAFDAILPDIVDETLTVQSIKKNRMYGNITAKEDGILYIALPYSSGYSIEVDGKKQEVLKIGTGLMGIEIEAGEHEICISYETPGIKLGAILSGIGILLCLILLLLKHPKKTAN